MKITVICGGRSPERDVSISTGRMVASALKRCGHLVALVDSAMDYEDNSENYFSKDENNSFDSDITDTAPDGDFAADRFGHYFGKGVLELCREADIVFNAMHGGAGEDGTLQAAFDLNGIAYTGSGQKGCMLAMDKQLTKDVLLAENCEVRTPKGLVLTRESYQKKRMPSAPAGLGFPLVVKPASGGSSVGVSIVDNLQGLADALSIAFRYEDKVLIEEYIKGREFSVGVLGDIALPAIEIIPKQGFYDYKNKYQKGMTDEICPADITAEQLSDMQTMALAVYNGLSLKAYARVDFIMTEAGKVYCLEANTLPGMTPMSLLPQEAAAAGIDFELLCQRIVEESVKKYDRS